MSSSEAKKDRFAPLTYEQMQQALRTTIQKLRSSHVEIMLGNHPRHNATLEKRAYMLAHPEVNPFIDPEEWPHMLRAMEVRLDDFAQKGW